MTTESNYRDMLISRLKSYNDGGFDAVFFVTEWEGKPVKDIDTHTLEECCRLLKI